MNFEINYTLSKGGGTEVSLDDEAPKLEAEQLPEPKEETTKEVKSEVKEPEPATVSASGDSEVSETAAAKKKVHWRQVR